jgi:hypothetical protein
MYWCLSLSTHYFGLSQWVIVWDFGMLPILGTGSATSSPESWRGLIASVSSFPLGLDRLCSSVTTQQSDLLHCMPHDKPSR